MGGLHPVICQMYIRQLPHPNNNVSTTACVVDAARAALLGTPSSSGGGFVWDATVCVYHTKAISESVVAMSADTLEEATCVDESKIPRWSDELNQIYEEFKNGRAPTSNLNKLFLRKVRSREYEGPALPPIRTIRMLPIEEQLDLLEDDEKIDTFLRTFQEELDDDN